jgi:hypothetical protein
MLPLPHVSLGLLIAFVFGKGREHMKHHSGWRLSFQAIVFFRDDVVVITAYRNRNGVAPCAFAGVDITVNFFSRK